MSIQIDKIHTTKLGTGRIIRNLGLTDTTDAVQYIKNIISQTPHTAIANFTPWKKFLHHDTRLHNNNKHTQPHNHNGA